MGREHGKVGAVTVKMGAKRPRTPRLQCRSAQFVHSIKTLASGGNVTVMEWLRPFQGRSEAATWPSMART